MDLILVFIIAFCLGIYAERKYDYQIDTVTEKLRNLFRWRR